MRRIELLVWSVGLAVAAGLLLRDPSWPGEADPAAAVIAVVRLVAGVLAGYLLVATMIAIVAESTESPLLTALARTVTTAGVRRLLAAMIGGGLLATPMLATAEPRDPAPVEAPVLRRVSPSDAMPAAAASTNVETAAPSTREHVVEAGQHLWSISELALAEKLGRTPTDDEVAPYWRELIELNRDRLPNPADPDLVFEGDRYLLP